MLKRIRLMWLKIRVRQTRYRVEDEQQSRRTALQATRMRIYRAKERHDEILAEYNAVKTAIDQHLSVWAMLKEKVRKHAVLLLQ